MARGIVARLEKNHLAGIFTILSETRRDLKSLQADVAWWPIPSLALLHGTALGSAIWDPNPNRRPVRVEDQVDAILYFGPPSSMTASKLAPALCSDRGYMEMRLWRLGLIPPPPGAKFSLADQLKDYCAHPEGQKELRIGNRPSPNWFARLFRTLLTAGWIPRVSLANRVIG
jgi:hypothetical protein